jgi:hypothetical protein
MSKDFWDKSARICEIDIRKIVQPGYQALVDAVPDPAKQVRVLADSQKQLKDLLCPRLPRSRVVPVRGVLQHFVGGLSPGFYVLSSKRETTYVHLQTKCVQTRRFGASTFSEGSDERLLAERH